MSISVIGTEMILVGISLELGTMITETNFNLLKFNCFTKLQHGIYYDLSKKGGKYTNKGKKLTSSTAKNERKSAFLYFLDIRRHFYDEKASLIIIYVRIDRIYVRIKNFMCA